MTNLLDIPFICVDAIDMYMGKWTTIWFRKDGTCVVDTSIFDSEEEAEEHRRDKEAFLLDSEDNFLSNGRNEWVLHEDYHYSLAIPTGRES